VSRGGKPRDGRFFFSGESPGTNSPFPLPCPPPGSVPYTFGRPKPSTWFAQRNYPDCAFVGGVPDEVVAARQKFPRFFPDVLFLSAAPCPHSTAFQVPRLLSRLGWGPITANGGIVPQQNPLRVKIGPQNAGASLRFFSPPKSPPPPTDLHTPMLCINKAMLVPVLILFVHRSSVSAFESEPR